MNNAPAIPTHPPLAIRDLLIAIRDAATRRDAFDAIDRARTALRLSNAQCDLFDELAAEHHP